MPAILAFLVLLSAGAGRAGQSPPAAPATDGPRLAVLIVVDQARADYLSRFRPLFRAGLRRLLDESFVFTDAHQDHGTTTTAPGHAALATGMHPRHNGIVDNNWYDRETDGGMYCVGDPVHGRSPANLLVDALPDWIKRHHAGSRAYSVGGKDRSAVLLGGHEADGAWWFDARDGQWTTSAYYRRRGESGLRGSGPEPEWVEEFNGERRLDEWFGRTWEPIPVGDADLEALGIVTPDEGTYPRGFPHAFGSLSLERGRGFYGGVWASPFVDAHMVDFIEALVVNESLGQPGRLDYLAVGFSGLDIVGHEYGPDSREVLDTVLNLDLSIGRLLDIIDREVGLDQTVVALSADHGVAPLPELRQRAGLPGRRVGAEEIACFQQVAKSVRDRYGEIDWMLTGLYLDYDNIADAGLDPDDFAGEVAGLLDACPSVRRVWTRAELLADEATSWPSAGSANGNSTYRRMVNSYHPDRSADLVIEWQPYVLTRLAGGTTHGTPHRYDSWVPMLIRLTDGRGAEIDRPVRTVDLAPTLAGWLEIPTPNNLDGRDLGELMRPAEWDD